MSSHSESVDEHNGDNIVDLMGLSSLEEGPVPADTPLSSNSSHRHKGAEEEGVSRETRPVKRREIE